MKVTEQKRLAPIVLNGNSRCSRAFAGCVLSDPRFVTEAEPPNGYVGGSGIRSTVAAVVGLCSR